ncbi:fibrobacter succinogenes major paralogous domain-containing protein [Aquirufa sp. ROCK2-A2]
MKEIKIGGQIWSAENLSIDTFQNGDLVPQALDEEDWINAGINKEPCWCYYEVDSNNGEEFGKLYNWFAVTDSRKLAPVGWEIASDLDFIELSDFLGGDELTGIKLKSAEYWSETDDSYEDIGFNALPGGCVNDEFDFFDICVWGCWWTSSEYDENCGRAYNLSNEFEELGSNDDDKRYGLSVRCIKSLEN